MSAAQTPIHGLAALLLEAGVVTSPQIEEGLSRLRETGQRIGEALVEIGAATEEDIGWALARQLGLPLVDLQSETLDAELLAEFPAGLLYRLHAVPLLRSDEGLSIAFSDPTDAQAIAHLEALAGTKVLPSVTTPSAIRRVLAPRLGALPAESRGGARPDGRSAPVVWDRSGGNFLHFQVFAARRAHARAVHFVADEAGVQVYHRLPEGLVAVAHEPPETYEALLTQLELLGAPVGGTTPAVHREAEVEVALPDGAVRMGVALLAHGGATHVTLRLPAGDSAPRQLVSLGFEPVDLARVREVLARPAGLVLVSGPAGSGCSTTLACLLAEALGENRSAMIFGTIPFQTPPGRVVFRLPEPGARDAWEPIVHAHEPDVVVLDDLAHGEDLAALTASAGMGRLVLARVDWGDTFALLEHLSHSPHARSATASRLHLVLQQRLLPADPEHPGAGVRARFEVFVVSEPMRDSIRSASPARALRQLAQAEGFRGFDVTLAPEARAGGRAAESVARALTS